MKPSVLIFLYNKKTQEFIKTHDESSISWCDDWMDAKDFGGFFFLFRPFLKLYLSKKWHIGLKWEMVYKCDMYKGVV